MPKGRASSVTASNFNSILLNKHMHDISYASISFPELGCPPQNFAHFCRDLRLKAFYSSISVGRRCIPAAKNVFHIKHREELGTWQMPSTQVSLKKITSLRPVYCTQQVPGQTSLHSESLPHKASNKQLCPECSEHS